MKYLIYISQEFINYWTLDKKTFQTAEVEFEDIDKFNEFTKLLAKQEIIILLSAKLYYNNIIKLPFANTNDVLKILPNIILDNHFENTNADEAATFKSVIYHIKDSETDGCSALISYIKTEKIKKLTAVFHASKIRAITTAHLFILDFIKKKYEEIYKYNFISKNEKLLYKFEADANNELKFLRTILKDANELYELTDKININELFDTVNINDFNEFIKHSKKYPASSFIQSLSFNPLNLLKNYINKNTFMLLIFLIITITFYMFAVKYNYQKENKILGDSINNLIKNNFNNLKVIVNPQAQTAAELTKLKEKHNLVISHTPLYIDYKNILNKIFMIFEKNKIIISKISATDTIMQLSGEGPSVGELDKLRIELISIIPEIEDIRITKSGYKNILTNTGAEFEMQFFLKSNILK